MLPFLKPKRISSIISTKYMSTPSEEHGEPEHSLMGCAEAMLAAIANKDAKALAEVLEELQEIDQALDKEQDSE